MPQRIQRKRTKGWRMPEGAIYVGRPTKWGNPFTVDGAIECGYADTQFEARSLCVTAFDLCLRVGDSSCWWFVGMDSYPHHDLIRAELAGKDLACWCPLDQPCHADVLLEIANS